LRESPDFFFAALAIWLADSTSARLEETPLSPVRKIRYLASCHEADNRESAIFDLFHREVKHRHFATGTEVLVSGIQDALAVPPELGRKALEEAALYKRERSLVYGAFLLVGKIDVDGKPRRLAAPLVHFPATLERKAVGGEEATFLRISPTEPTLNFPVLAELLGEHDLASSALDAIGRRLPAHPVGTEALSEIIQIFRELLPRVRVDDLYAFPELLTEKAVRLGSENAALACIPAAALALVENPRSTRGVLFELSQLASSERVSPPIEAALGGAAAASPPPLPLASIPAVLSRAQRKVLESAHRHPLTLIVGPPGTGKSYTVTALALEHLARGESVLVACRTEQALDVIESKLRSMLGETTPVLRGGSTDYTRELKGYLTLLLSGQLEEEDSIPLSDRKRRLGKAERELARIERRIGKRNRLESAWGDLASRPPSFSSLLRGGLLQWRLGREKPLWELVEALERAETERVEAARALLHATRRARIVSLLRKHRAELKRFNSAIRARSSGRQEALFAEMNLSLLLEAFPLWMSTFRDLGKLAPFEREMFDLVVVDEATQSDMASALPALYRARRAAVTGDPKQLRHVSFLSRDRQRLLGEESGLSEEEIDALDYREKSLLDLVDDCLPSSEQSIFLDEHFRSMPSIIAFSNREFYSGRLRVMTARPSTLRLRSVELRRVDGKRDENGRNLAEAEALAAELASLVERESSLPRGRCHSIGVLSPFRDQVEHLVQILTERLGIEAIEKHDLLVATPYGFQGEERDFMFLSLAVDRESHPQAFRHLNQPDVFNVAITRARNRQLVLASLDPLDMPEGSLAARYLGEISRSADAATEPSDIPGDDFLDRVSARLSSSSFRVYRAFLVAGTVVDLVVERGGKVFGIDLIGQPGALGAPLDLERYRMLRRAGLSVFPLSLASWVSDEASCLQAIERHPSLPGSGP
jgi:hypothetical protein